MSTEPPIPTSDGPWPDPIPPPEPPPPPREPAWTGIELTGIIILTVLAMLAFTVSALLIWALMARSSHQAVAATTEFRLVLVTLIGQTAGLATGFFFARQWIRGVRGRDFAAAIHWQRLKGNLVLALLGAGVVLTIVVQLLGDALPMPKTAPIDQLFTPRTAWFLLIYGVVVAPFFEEFFFRGLLYPTLLSTFQDGMSEAELRAWRPMTRLLAGTGAAAALFWHWRIQVLGQVHPTESAALMVIAFILAASVVLPQGPIGIAGWIVNALARWRHPELLAILLTGFLFGMLHAAQLGWAWAAVLILVLVGIVLTTARARTGSLRASWLMHTAYNGTLFVAQYFVTRGFHHFS